MSSDRTIVHEIEVPGTPEQVWQAIAPGQGITGWFVPAQVEERTGGTMQLDFGPGMGTSEAAVTVWEPPSRFVHQGNGATGHAVAYEWQVEARSGGTCVVRLVTSGFLSDADWQVEYDAEYRGDWGSFFAAYQGNDAALLGAHIHRFDEWPSWCWWPSLGVPGNVQITRAQLRKAFMAVFRITREGVEAAVRAHRAGWVGHFEVVLPMALLCQGLRLDDLLVAGPCYIGPSQNPTEILALQSTVRYRPPISVEEFCQRGQGPLLFHPVKDNYAYDGQKVVLWPTLLA